MAFLPTRSMTPGNVLAKLASGATKSKVARYRTRVPPVVRLKTISSRAVKGVEATVMRMRRSGSHSLTV